MLKYIFLFCLMLNMPLQALNQSGCPALTVHDVNDMLDDYWANRTTGGKTKLFERDNQGWEVLFIGDPFTTEEFQGGDILSPSNKPLTIFSGNKEVMRCSYTLKPSKGKNYFLHLQRDP